MIMHKILIEIRLSMHKNVEMFGSVSYMTTREVAVS